MSTRELGAPVDGTRGVDQGKAAGRANRVAIAV